MDLQQIGMFGLTTLVGLVGYYFKKNSDRQDKADESLNFKIDNVEKNLSDYKLEAEKTFVSKDEFIRSVSNIDKKLDKIYDEMMKMNACNTKNNN